MEKGKRITKALGGILVGGMLLSGGLAFAGDANGAPAAGVLTPKASIGQDLAGREKMWKHKCQFKADRQQNLEKALDQLVKDGTLNPVKADEVKAYIDKVTKERKTRKLRVYSGLVENSILTQAQADALKAKVKEIRIQQRRQRISDGLNALVKEGTITAEQSVKIMKQMEKAQQERKALFEKTKGMTKEERHQYMKDHKDKIKNPLSELVENGSITGEQAKAIRNSVFGHKNLQTGRG